MRYQAYPSGTKAPSLVLGDNDGVAAREMIAAAKDGPAPKVKVTLDIQRVPNLKTSLVWGTLPGATDETIYITAHKDGWFQSAGDNAGGRCLDARARRVLREDPAGPAQADDGVHRPRRASQRPGRRGRDALADRPQRHALRENRAADQRRASVDDHDADAAAILSRQRDRLGEHVHAAGMVRGRQAAAGASGDCVEGVQAIRRPARTRSRARRRRRAISARSIATCRVSI